jgi:hypothetical protein
MDRWTLNDHILRWDAEKIKVENKLRQVESTNNPDQSEIKRLQRQLYLVNGVYNSLVEYLCCYFDNSHHQSV